jgi:hypothetical protein
MHFPCACNRHISPRQNERALGVAAAHAAHSATMQMLSTTAMRSARGVHQLCCAACNCLCAHVQCAGPLQHVGWWLHRLLSTARSKQHAAPTPRSRPHISLFFFDVLLQLLLGADGGIEEVGPVAPVCQRASLQQTITSKVCKSSTVRLTELLSLIVVLPVPMQRSAARLIQCSNIATGSSTIVLCGLASAGER